LAVAGIAVYHAAWLVPSDSPHCVSIETRASPNEEFSMAETSLDALDLAALLCSRVCHDLISPIGAIVNGLEVLAEEKDQATQQFALDLINKSSRTASAKLQFCRIAFGAAGSAGAQLDSGDAETISRGFFEDDKTKLVWNLPRAMLPKNRVKLLLNMLLIAGQAIPRGGTLTLDAIGTGETTGFKIRAAGTNAKVAPAVPPLLAGDGGSDGVDAHRIQPFYTGLLARSCGLAVGVASEADAVVVATK
jgi:histidine phosphotransferase ChpT